MRLAKKISLSCILSLLCLVVLSACGGAETENGPTAGKIQIVAAENFYGNIAEQIGGDHVEVTSIISDPGIDPHEFEADPKTARLVSDATFVIVNGGGFDDWMDHLLEASPSDERVLINVYDDVAVTKLGENEHVWYGIDNVTALAQRIAKELKEVDGANATTYDGNLQTFEQEMQSVQQKMDAIKQEYSGTKVGLTETIFAYQAEPMGLDVITPEDLQEAIAEDNDPPSQSVITATEQLANKEARVLILNGQVTSPITTNLETVAKDNNIPVVSISEMLPVGKTYQQWMLEQLTSLEDALMISQ